MNGHRRPDVPIIGQRTQVVLREQRIIAPATVEVADGGLTLDNCVAHLRVLDNPNGVMWHVPLTPQMMGEAHKTLGDLITGQAVIDETGD